MIEWTKRTAMHRLCHFVGFFICALCFFMNSFLRLTSVALDFFASNYIPTNPKEFAGRIFVTCYMGTENSSEETRKRASNLAEEIGSHHMGEGTVSYVFSIKK